MIESEAVKRTALSSVCGCACLAVLLWGCGGNAGAEQTDTGTGPDSVSDPSSDSETDTGTAADGDADVDTDADGDSESGSDTTPEAGTETETETDTELRLSIEEIEASWVTIPAGEFVYGSPESVPCRGAASETQVEVIITRSYKMAATEVTRAQWRMTGLPDPSMAAPCDDCAEGYVNWYDTLYWLNSLSRAAGLPECYDLSDCVGTPSGGCHNGREYCMLDAETKEILPEIYWCNGDVHRYPDRVDCPGYRLPTSAEWEWAARGGTTTATYNGDITEDTTACLQEPVLDPIGWYCGNTDLDMYSTLPVAGLRPNDYGLYDMLGNVLEWTSDVYTGGSLQSNDGREPPLVDPVGTRSIGYRTRPMRGGGVIAPACRSTVSTHHPEQQQLRGPWTGFRPVRTLLE